MKIHFFTFLLLMTAFNCIGQNVENLTLHFGFDKSNIENKFKLNIDSAINGKVLQEINIEAHCDAVGSMDYNDSLSFKRAMEVKNYLISKNINENTIKVSAFGKRVPIAKNAAMNRRAEIRFVFKPLDSIPKIETIEKEVVDVLGINNLEVGATIRLDNINFIGGEHYFLEGSIRPLVRLLNTLESYPNLEIEIQGYICCTNDGSDGYDNSTGTPNLSVNRAKAVYDFLVKKGIDAKRLTYKGFGSSKKLVEEVTEIDRITNRRVEIKIVNK